MNLAYAVSRRTSETERNYHSSKHELLAVVWCATRLRSMLINIHFTVATDCKALVYLNSHRTKNAQIVRWHNALSEYDYDIVHRQGSKLAHADALSCAPADSACEGVKMINSGNCSLVNCELVNKDFILRLIIIINAY